MKNIIVFTLPLLLFSSCTVDSPLSNTNDTQVDSAVTARVEALRTQLMIQNDSTIKALATLRADSLTALIKKADTSEIK